MFEFKYAELMNWAYWPTIKLPLDEHTIMITGPNGSGKTTFLDSLRVLLRAPNLSSGRRFIDYLQTDVDTAVIKGVVSNFPQADNRRPFEFKGYHTDDVTLAAILKQRSGRWERRYVILENDVPLAEIQKIPRSHMLSPETYTFELAQAGFGSAFLKVLALEQGKTDKLCEKSPRDLLDLLLEVHGDKQVIERYREARENYQRANIELTRLGTRLAEEQAKVIQSERAAKEYERYIQLTREQENYETILLPQAEYKELIQKINQIKLEIQEYNLKLGPIDRQIAQLQEQIAQADAEREKRARAVEEAQARKVELEKRERDLDIQLAQLVREQSELQKIVALAENSEDTPDRDKIFARRSQLQKEIVKLELREEELVRRQNQLKQEVLNLEVPHKKVYPRFVDEFTRLLSRANIEFDLLCDLVEITEKEWQLAIESILGRDRFTVIVKPEDQLKARQLGQQYRYRCYIVAKENGAPSSTHNAHPDAAIHVVKLLKDGIPQWITENLKRTVLVRDVEDGMKLGPNVVSVTQKGYRQDRRGGISIAVDSFYCGSLGQSSLREDLQKAVHQIASELGTIRKELADKRSEEAELQKVILLQENLDKVQNAQQRLQELAQDIPNLNSQHKEALQLKRQAEHALIDALEKLNSFEHELSELRRQLDQLRSQQSDSMSELKDLHAQTSQYNARLSEIAAKVPGEYLTEKKLADVPPLDELTPKYYSIKRLLSEYTDPPDQAAVEIYQHHKSQYEKQRKVYEEYEAALKRWENEFKLARAKYVVVIEHTIATYRNNVLSLARLAGVDAEVVMPSLHDADIDLEETELNIRFGFDGKKVRNMASASLSGGQRVIASLILLMSLATSGGPSQGGFFIIDEPFAHLSIERIDDVTRFLNSTNCQFILTSPTTHNVNIFSAAKLQMN
ncbi:MAG: hypothetical protein D6781_05710, partial [Verrucomicrobia bacterium]